MVKKIKIAVISICLLMGILSTQTLVKANAPQTRGDYTVIIQAVIRDSDGHWVSTNALESKNFNGTTVAGSSGGGSEETWQWTPSGGGYELTTTFSSHANAWGGLKYPTALWNYDSSELKFVGIGRNSYATEVAYPDDVDSSFLFERNSYLLANSEGGGWYRTYIFEQISEPQPQQPEAPDETTVEELLNEGAVKVDCINTEVSHADGIYGLMDGYTIGEVYGDAENGYKVDITIAPDPYVDQYNTDRGVSHTLSPDTQGEETITLIHVDGAWAVGEGETPVVYEVICETPQPQQPEAPDETTVEELLNEGAVKVDCINTEVSHADGIYGLMDGYTIGEVYGDAENGYKVDITIAPDPYVDQYNTDRGVSHTLSPDTQGEETITLIHVDGAWAVGEGETPVLFNVLCEEKEPVIPVIPDDEKPADPEKENPQATDDAGEPSADDSTDTGIQNDLVFWSGLVCVSALLAITGGIKRRKSK